MLGHSQNRNSPGFKLLSWQLLTILGGMKNISDQDVARQVSVSQSLDRIAALMFVGPSETYVGATVYRRFWRQMRQDIRKAQLGQRSSGEAVPELCYISTPICPKDQKSSFDVCCRCFPLKLGIEFCHKSLALQAHQHFLQCGEIQVRSGFLFGFARKETADTNGKAVQQDLSRDRLA